MKKKGKKAKGRAKIKDLAVNNPRGAAVKGGRIVNIRANASGITSTSFTPKGPGL